MDMRRALAWLVVAALVLPMTIAVLVGVARLLDAMQDQAGAAVLDRVALAAGIIWAVNLIALVVAQAIHLLVPPPRRPPE